MPKIILNPAEGELVEKKSRFICNLFPIYHENEIENYLQMIKKQHYSARHHCYAWILGENKRAFDDGEPSGSAGMPILHILEKEGYQNILAIVTRYFGGTLLGVGGLTRAYSGAVSEALGNVESFDLEEGFRFRIRMEYSHLGPLEHLIERNEGLYRIQVGYGEKVDYEFMVQANQTKMVETFIQELMGGEDQFIKNELEKYIVSKGQVIRNPSW